MFKYILLFLIITKIDGASIFMIKRAIDCDICASPYIFDTDGKEYICKAACFFTPNVPSYKYIRGINMTKEELDHYDPSSGHILYISSILLSITTILNVL